MKRINEICFLKLNTVEIASPNAKSLCANSGSTHDSKIKRTYSTQGSIISNTPKKTFLNAILKLNTRTRADLTRPNESLINIFVNTFHVKQSLQRAQSFTWNTQNILSYV